MARIAHALSSALGRSKLRWDERVQLAGGLFVAESLSPYWCAGRTPAEAHELLREAEPEVADAVEAIAPMLLSRVMTQAEARDAVRAVEQLIEHGSHVGG
ncbi:MAG: hypothetical protein O3C25_04750 [Chloroflexi bacterium]|nr:hypothetical protein [Chloroflexota bacterium]